MSDAAEPAPGQKGELRRPAAFLAWPTAIPKPSATRTLQVAALLAAFAVIAPVLGVALSILEPTGSAWASLSSTVLPRYLLNTLALVAMVGVGVLAIGVPAAWLVTMYVFPGRRILEVALALPLACPAYVVGYAYAYFLSHPGPMQSSLRAAFELGPRDYWFPQVQSVPGAAAMLTFVLYPYVYLLARAAFLQQSRRMLDVSRTLGAAPRATFYRVALPMARPAIVTGLALALMETLADYGTVSYFGVQTFSTGVFKAWFSMGDRIAAAQLAGWLLMLVLLLLALERWSRSDRRFQSGRAQFEALPQPRLTGWLGWAATGLCLIPAILGFALPVAILFWMSLIDGHDLFTPRYLTLIWNSFTLSALAAAVAVGVAVLMAYAARLAPGPLSTGATLLASMGYALPGSVIAVGVVIPMGGVTVALNPWLRENLGFSLGLLLTSSIFALTYAYVVRYLAVALQTAEASLGKVTPSMDHAARSLGENSVGALRRVHLPMIRGGLLTAALIVFVDVMKELPATLLMRPFNFDTLAVQTHNLASDDRLFQASTPALAIVAVGLLPVIFLSREIRRTRPS
ncbi:MAG: iron ABC transporter permease [Pseudomonadota bacterium]